MVPLFSSGLGRRSPFPHHLLAHLLLDRLTFGAFLRTDISSGTLLIHLRARRDAIESKVNKLPRPHELHQSVKMRFDSRQHLVLVLGQRLAVLRVAARVHDPVQIEVEVVAPLDRISRLLLRVGLGLVQAFSFEDLVHHRRVALFQPLEEGGDAHGCCLARPRPRGDCRARVARRVLYGCLSRLVVPAALQR